MWCIAFGKGPSVSLENLTWNASLPSNAHESLKFTVDSVAVPVDPVISDTLAIRKGAHVYNASVRLEIAHFYAPKHTYRQLGMLIMANLFSSSGKDITITLEHPSTQLKWLVIAGGSPTVAFEGPGYLSQPFAFSYYPEVPLTRHPLHESSLHPWDCPGVVISNEADICETDSDYASRDTLYGFGTPKGASRFAELLLNIGLPDTTRDEFHLEAYPGFRSVNPLSAEISLWLPGSIGWLEQELP